MKLCLAFWMLVVAAIGFGPSTASAAEPNETFETATLLGAGVLTTVDSLTPGDFVNAPDTLLGARDALNMITEVDDDSSVFGDGTASALEIIPTNAGAIAFAITGFGDDGFTGDHDESGDYEVFVAAFDSSGEIVESFSEFHTLAEGQVDEFTYFYDEAVDYDVFIDNIVAPGGDIDFFTFTGLTPGQSFTAETSDPLELGLDTLLALFDDQGLVIDENDDIDTEAENYLSLLTGVVPASGKLTFAVTGFGDAFYTGDHYQEGAYALTLDLGGDLSSADFNGDLAVDRLDLLQWEGDFGPTNASSADDDDDSDGADFLVWQRELHAPGGATAAPEPATLWLAACAGAMLGRRRFKA